VNAQDSLVKFNIANIQSPFTLQARRNEFKNYLLNKTIKETFLGPLNQNTEYRFEDAWLSAIQFMICNQYTQRGMEKMFELRYLLDQSARETMQLALYALYPKMYQDKVLELLKRETNAKLFAMEALYCFRNDSSESFIRNISLQINNKFAQSDNIPILVELKRYLTNYRKDIVAPTPPLKELFNYQQLWKQKTIYSFQRWDRDFTGICIIQYADGSFAKDSSGKLLTFRQLARSGSGMPYFITNGNTPQGIYRIAGIGSSIDHLIGPTPNLQTLIPFQNDQVFYRGLPYDSTAIALDNYKILLPPSWQSYSPMQESFFAGNIGRRYIIIHGSTLDPEFFKDKDFYPLTPTDGCLVTSERWDSVSGKLQESTQLNLVNTFLRTPGTMGLLVVVNIDNQQKDVSAEEIQMLIKKYEEGLKK
jgi:hypothetical protein